MKIGKLLKIGESFGVTVQKPYLRELGWQIGDTLTQEIRGDELVIRNIQPHAIQFSHTRKAYGDGAVGRGASTIPRQTDPS